MNGEAAPIIVVGAGIGGLAAALLLARTGWSVTLVEKRGRVEEEGAGLQLSPNASRVLIEAGLGPKLAKCAGAPERIRIRRARNGRELASIPLGKHAAERYGAPYFVIHRADLASLLLDALRSEKRVRPLYGREARGFGEQGNGVAVTLSGERGVAEEFPGAAVIVADGLWGTLATPGPPPRFSGFAAWRALIPASSAPGFARANEVGLWLAPGAHLVHYPLRGGEAVNIVAVLPERRPLRGWSRRGEADAIRSALASWREPARALIAAASDWRCWSLFDCGPRRGWGAGLATLIGDAAHPMLPFLAQGAAMAIEDAAVLAHMLAPLSLGASRGEMAAALWRYEQARQARAARAQREARRNAFAYHAPWPLAAARDLVLRATPGERLLARYDWLYGWRGEPVRAARGLT